MVNFAVALAATASLSLLSGITANQNGASHSIRGVPAFLQEKYKVSAENTFHCDNGAKSVPFSAINDGFCDCEDGSDEPGTSACGSTGFYCVNQGYRTMSIPSSRVDDGICDCCDGSDEGNVIQCPNTCDALAEKEREMITKLTAAYNEGKKIRLEQEERIRQELTEKAKDLDELKANVQAQGVILDGLREKRFAAKKVVDEIHEKLKTEAKTKVRELLKIDSLSAQDLGHLTHVLLNLVDYNPDDVTRHLRQTGDFIDRSLEDNYQPPPLSTSRDNGEASGSINSEESGPNSGSANPIENDSKPQILSCDGMDSIGQEDPRIALMCVNGVLNLETAMRLISESIMESKKPVRELSLLMGYFEAKGTFSGSEEFVRDALTQSEDTCPELFASSSTAVCDLSSRVRGVLSVFSESMEVMFPELESVTAHKSAENAYYSYQSEYNLLLDRKDSAERAKRDLEVHESHLSLLAFKDECFEIDGGHYTYRICYLDKVTQSESGHSSVSLGSYQSVSSQSLSQDEDGSLVMSFSEGQHCHAFGPRSAQVKLTCGPVNKVLTAREPSTCFYSFEMESPSACTKEFAIIHGIQDN